MRHFEPHDSTTAPEQSRALLERVREQRGFVASPLTRIAASPALLGLMLDALHRFEQSSLTASEREVLAFTLAYENGCGYCMALHSALAARIGELAPHVERLRNGEAPPTPRLSALADFVRAILRARGNVPDDAWQAFLAAGYTHENALDVVMGVGTYTLTTFANRLVQAPLDKPLERFAWQEDRAPSVPLSA